MDRYGYTEYRLELLDGLKTALSALRVAGCRRVYIDGSFVTAKEEPRDYDACWEPEGVDLPRLALLLPTLFDFHRGRRAQKYEFGGELFPADSVADSSGVPYVDFFQRDELLRPKGIVAIDPGDSA